MKAMICSLATVALALAAPAARPASADDCCCHCGDGCGVRKVCRLVPDKKKITKTCYGCQCEDICLPGRSCRGCLNCEEVCEDGNCCRPSCGCQDGCDDCKDHKPLCCLQWFDWTPSCAKVRTVKKLVKYTATKEVCSWKWKVEKVCQNCCPGHCCEPGPGGLEVDKSAASDPALSAEDLASIPPVPGTATARR